MAIGTYIVLAIFLLGRGHARNASPHISPFESQPGNVPDNLDDNDFRNNGPTAAPIKSNYTEVTGWPSEQISLGEISAVSLDNFGNVVIFHRGNRTWDYYFDSNYQRKNEGPITQNTIITYDPDSGRIIHRWGANLFFMPHGLTVDEKGNIFVTDVALNQVFKFPPRGRQGRPSMVLGERFVEGNDKKHFCKPTAVAVAKSGDFFVADGYCNKRVIKFNSKGEFIFLLGQNPNMVVKSPAPTDFNIPHALALAEDKNRVCVADRENGRIQCFTIDSGIFVSQFAPSEFGKRVYSVAYTPSQSGMLFAVNGRDDIVPVRGFAIGFTNQQVTANFGNLKQPHDVAVSLDGRDVFIVELDPQKITKFVDRKL
ncbi:peptidyl-alpha-hydroxyglycine alpha-amidating lyase 1-like [Neocloeon triangulifer]|uniref:peptidyl-alpha-hydroxyglycine alpha-amidating lyase 1-like n=1 Tax=Neocloeon triangulifer TaxID=2078957 RepID=UPI00286F89FF|nr:peptidyl-alpha-hydroxyglycine alpha-amidating lyase 1-like [Neocloeon triangulifer]